MPRKKEKTIPPLAVKLLIFIVSLILISLVVYKYCIKNFAYFTVTEIMVDPTLGLGEERELKKIKGKNIFTVNLREIYAKLLPRYPYVADLKVIKRYPNQIVITGKKRVALARAVIQGRTITIDESGVVLPDRPAKPNEILPLIYGVAHPQEMFGSGLHLEGPEVDAALKIIQAFQGNRALLPYPIVDMHVEDISKIVLRLVNNLHIIIDSQNISEKIGSLGIVLSREKMNPAEIQYLDLRFGEPVVKKRVGND